MTPLSGDSLLNHIRAHPLGGHPTPRVLSVDDFALRRGRTYGTILVDLERHQVVDLLPDRTATTLVNWLMEHPGVAIITRDRDGEYALGARLGAPGAQQVADRFHLLRNLRDVVRRILTRHATSVAQAPAPGLTPTQAVGILVRRPSDRTEDEQRTIDQLQALHPEVGHAVRR